MAFQKNISTLNWQHHFDIELTASIRCINMNSRRLVYCLFKVLDFCRLLKLIMPDLPMAWFCSKFVSQEMDKKLVGFSLLGACRNLNLGDGKSWTDKALNLLVKLLALCLILNSSRKEKCDFYYCNYSIMASHILIYGKIKSR